MAKFVSVSRASRLAGAALLSAIAISAGCSADVNPVAPGAISSNDSFTGSATAARSKPADDGKLAVCHRTQGTNGFVLISIAAVALDAHLAHGDGRPGEHVPGQPDRTFGSGCEVSVSSPTRVTIGFSGLAGNAGAFSTYAESGFTVSVTGPSSFTRDWEVATSYGNPAPFIQFSVPAGSSPTSGAISVSGSSAAFRLASVDLYSSLTPIPYELRGFLNGTAVFTATGTVPNTFGSFQTVINPYAGVLVDSVTIVLTNPAPVCCGNPVGLDNIVLLTAAE